MHILFNYLSKYLFVVDHGRIYSRFGKAAEDAEEPKQGAYSGVSDQWEVLVYVGRVEVVLLAQIPTRHRNSALVNSTFVQVVL